MLGQEMSHGTLPQLHHLGRHKLHCELGEAGLGAVAVVFLGILKTGTQKCSDRSQQGTNRVQMLGFVISSLSEAIWDGVYKYCNTSE